MSETPRTDAVEWRSGKNLADCQFVVFSEFARQLEAELADKEKQLAEARAENNVLKAALWHYGNRMGPNIAEELKDGLPERLWRKINLKEVEETDGEEIE